VKPRRQRGFTLIEVMMSVVLLAIGAALAIPSYRDMVEKRQLTNAAEQLAAFVNSTQTIASRTNEVITVSYRRRGADEWCVGATMGVSACNCEQTDSTATDYCEIESRPFVLNQSISTGAELMQEISAQRSSYSFDPVRGIFTNMDDYVTMKMHSNSRDYKLNLMVNATGRVILCSEDESHSVPGYDVCL
jgi:type IV fimbrial biogenesis protein FimT